MTIAGTPLARNAALIEAGLDVSLSPSAMLGISYNAEIASNVEDHGVSGRGGSRAVPILVKPRNGSKFLLCRASYRKIGSHFGI
ncbi:MAG TPA: hypothetical protein PK857_03725 [Hyphomicrobium sp.]|nr:hypothetical protein [Hyphomicrobium sp.]HRO48638.1 hypothetical protein [Hyphomicrobium sp.]